jgi:hypothetical protein
MGLRSLKSKIETKLKQSEFSETDVVYLIIEIRKYIERSGRSYLHNPEDVEIEQSGYDTLNFIRNWIAHTEHYNELKGDTKTILENLHTSEDNDMQQAQLLKNLISEINNFCSAVGIDTRYTANLNQGSFEHSLKEVLAEQPVLRADKTRVGYGENLKLKTF